MSASDVSLSSHHMSHHPLTLHLPPAVFCLVVVVVLVAWVLVFASCFASVIGFCHSSVFIRPR